MGFMCKTCLKYERDRGDVGWGWYGWQAEDRCSFCTPDVVQELERSLLAMRLRDMVKALRVERDEIIRRFNKDQLKRRDGHCAHCYPAYAKQAALAEALREAHRMKDEAMEKWVTLVLKYECKDEETQV